MYVAKAADVDPTSLFEILKVSTVFDASSPTKEMYGLLAGTRTCSLYVPGAMRITQRDALFTGTLSIASDTVRTSPPPLADTRITQSFAKACVAAVAITVNMPM